ncbi:MAG: sugar phosphate isomerase/epimerase family protein [Halanaerobiaceae bacterium]
MKNNFDIMSSTHLRIQKSWEQQLQTTKNLGMKGIELFGQEIFVSDLKKIKNKNRRLNLILTAHPWFDFNQLEIKQAQNKFLEFLEVYIYLGVKIINVHLNFFATPETGVKRITEIINPIIPQLKQNDIKLVFENTPINGDNPLGSSPEHFENLFDLLENNSHIGFTLDTGHANISSSLHKFTDKLQDKWIYTHLNDNHGESDQHLGPGMGSINWRNFFSQIDRVNYNGYFIYEFPEKYLTKSINLMKSCF